MSGWDKLLSVQNEYDIFIINNAVFYDNADEPFPHTIFKQAKVGGFGKDSPNAPSGIGKAAMVSTIMFSDIEYFREKTIAEDEVADVIGIYYLAHEFGHMLLNLPDVYDHPHHCLMNTSSENNSIPYALRMFASHEGPCPMCMTSLLKGKKALIKKLEELK